MPSHPYLVIDRHTHAIVARCKTKAGARRARDRRDMEYGACRYFVRCAIDGESVL